MNNLQLLTNYLFIFVISPDKLKQQGLIYRANAAVMLQGEPLEMQHVAQLGCQRFTTQQTVVIHENIRLNFIHLITLTNYTRQPMILTHSCRPSHCVTANCRQVTTTEQTGLQELALDVEKMGVLWSNNSKGTRKENE